MKSRHLGSGDFSGSFSLPTRSFRATMERLGALLAYSVFLAGCTTSGAPESLPSAAPTASAEAAPRPTATSSPRATCNGFGEEILTGRSQREVEATGARITLDATAEAGLRPTLQKLDSGQHKSLDWSTVPIGAVRNLQLLDLNDGTALWDNTIIVGEQPQAATFTVDDANCDRLLEIAGSQGHDTVLPADLSKAVTAGLEASFNAGMAALSSSAPR